MLTHPITILQWWHAFKIRYVTFRVDITSISNHHDSLVWTLRSIMLTHPIQSISLTPETFIMSMFRLSFRFTFGTNTDINFSLWWFGFRRNNGPRPDSTLSPQIRLYDDEEPELKPQETDIKISPNLIYDTISPPIHRI